MLEGEEVKRVPMVCYPVAGKKNGRTKYESTDIYRPSRLIRALQYTLDKNVVRKWSNNVLLQDFLKMNSREQLGMLE